MRDLTPRQIVAELDRDIVGQADAKRSVAIALRNRWRRQQLPEEARGQITPKNILMIGPTGVGKTEIARRLAELVGAPFLKVEATKYTEVGYVGRDVEGMVRDLVEAAIGLVRAKERERVGDEARNRAEEKLLDLLMPPARGRREAAANEEDPDRSRRSREKLRAMLADGDLEDREVEIVLPGRSAPPVSVIGASNMEQMEMELQGMFEKFMPKPAQARKLPIREARPLLVAQETEALLDPEAVRSQGVALAEQSGILFIDEIDKVAGEDGSNRGGPDVSRQGVQRDLLPIVEGTTVGTKHGPVRTDHVLFIAAGAFHKAKPSDLMPELQGRFPIRVELHDLTKEDFARILREPRASLIKQHQALLSVEGVDLELTPDAVERIAEMAYQVNRSTQNIGARRLHTILERLLDEVSFEAPDLEEKRARFDAADVERILGPLAADEDLSRFIL